LYQADPATALSGGHPLLTGYGKTFECLFCLGRVKLLRWLLFALVFSLVSVAAALEDAVLKPWNSNSEITVSRIFVSIYYSAVAIF
jgi:hypothetical protein